MEHLIFLNQPGIPLPEWVFPDPTGLLPVGVMSFPCVITGTSFL